MPVKKESRVPSKSLRAGKSQETKKKSQDRPLKNKGQALTRTITPAKRSGLKRANATISTGKKPVNATKRSIGPSAEVFNISGKREGNISLPSEIFGAKVNKKLLAQALHIYFVNRSAHHGSAKTRSEVRGGGAKPWRQKGTGRARAGSRRSPLWVGGAKALGPKPRKTVLTLPKKMKRQSLISALCTKAQNNEIKIVSNFEKIPPKTKIVANFLQKTQQKGSTLFVISAKNNNVILATRNLQKVLLNTADGLNTFEVIKNQNLIFTKEALQALSVQFAKKVEREAKT